jgi:hypothetical protein
MLGGQAGSSMVCFIARVDAMLKQGVRTDVMLPCNYVGLSRRLVPPPLEDIEPSPADWKIHGHVRKARQY